MTDGERGNVLGHRRDLLGLADTSGMGDIRLNDIDTSSLKVRSDIQTREQSLAKLDMSDDPTRRLERLQLTAIGMVVLLYRSFSSLT
jgi:hypothetical protein